MSVHVWECTACRRAAFPRPLCCPVCGGSEFIATAAESGVVEQVTRAPGRPDAAATVRCDGGVRLLARVPADTGPGDRLLLTHNADVLGAAWVPAPS